MLPDARLDVQSPLAPLAGAALASQGFGLHDVSLKLFDAAFSFGLPVYPASHVHAPAAGPPLPVLFLGHDTGVQLPGLVA